MIDDLRERIERTVADQAEKDSGEAGIDEAELRQKLHDDVARFVYERTKRQPWCCRSSSKSDPPPV